MLEQSIQIHNKCSNCSFNLVFRSKGEVKTKKMPSLRTPLANFFWPKNAHFLTDRLLIKKYEIIGESLSFFFS